MRKYITIPNSPIPQRADASGAAIGRAPLAAGVARPGGVRENADGADSAGLSEMDRRQREIYNKQQQLLRDQRTADQEKLLVSISGVQNPPASPYCRMNRLTWQPCTQILGRCTNCLVCPLASYCAAHSLFMSIEVLVL